MRTYVDQRYREECQRFKLMATCEHCQHYAPPDRSCSLGFPTAPHRDEAHQAAKDGEPIWYCKYFTVD